MTTSSAQFQNRGNQADYALGTTEDWGAFDVVRWHAVEEVSHPFTVDITLQRDAASGPVDLDALLDSGATFRIASQGRWRVMHGILAEAEEIDRTATILLYRVLLVPHVWRARYRTRCRNFVDRSIKEILAAVLENRSPAHPKGNLGLAELNGKPTPPAVSPSFKDFTEPRGLYRWSVGDETRITDATISPYVVQYNESDFDFLSRLLEQEGLSYYFEHTDDAAVLTITDAPGQRPLFATDETFTLRGVSQSAAIGAQEVVRSLRDARRMQSRAVTMRDYDYHRSLANLEAEAATGKGDHDVAGHFEFPAGDELVQKSPGLVPATIRMERCNVERRLQEGTGTVRTMEVGYQFKLEDGDHLRSDVELLAVRVETYAVQLAPVGTVLDEEPFGFAGSPPPAAPSQNNRFLALYAKAPFRPALRTPRPRIHGVQTATVTAEEFPSGARPKINVDELGRVRLRFPWDQRPDEEGAPSSDWIRVSQYWAGGGFGALYTPRVGHEVLVAYLQGDPDRPVIVGRVYNAQNTPPYDPSARPTVSTVKSDTSPKGPGFNELRFEDLTGKEEVFLHAQRDLNEVVLGSHSTSVGGVQTNTVGKYRIHTVNDFETVTVVSDRTTLFHANEHHTVDGFRDTHIGVNETLEVGSFRETTIGANDDLLVKSCRNTTVDVGDMLKVGGPRTVTVGGEHNVTSQANYTAATTATHKVTCTALEVDSTTAEFNQGTSFHLNAGGAKINVSAGVIVLDNGAGASVALVGGLIVLNGACVMGHAGGLALLTAGGDMDLIAGGGINAVAPAIKLNG
jgi:type VI secretion system secreted protein VgrG